MGGMKRACKRRARKDMKGEIAQERRYPSAG